MQQENTTPGSKQMDRRKFLAGTAALASGIAPALAQGGAEVSFFYPIAVGGPIAKIIDGFAADFEKANPSIKIKPIYSGSYQESITKALTAHKSGTPPVTTRRSPFTGCVPSSAGVRRQSNLPGR